MTMVCIWEPGLFTHVVLLCGTNLQRVPFSSFPSSDINIWANAVRQLLEENPQQSLAVTTRECSSEGHTLQCHYKQHKDGGKATTELPPLPFSCVLLCCILWGFFFRTTVRLQAVASASICSHTLIMITNHSHPLMSFTQYNCRLKVGGTEEIWWRQ